MPPRRAGADYTREYLDHVGESGAGLYKVERANPADPGDQSKRVTAPDGSVTTYNEWGQPIDTQPAPRKRTAPRDDSLNPNPYAAGEAPRVRDSGQRKTYDTGSRRDTSHKGAFSLMPFLVLFDDAFLYEQGDVKYGAGVDGQDRNWELGQPFSRLYESAIRHVLMAALGFTDEPHLAQARWNLACIAHFKWMGRNDLNDMPDYGDEVRAKLKARFAEHQQIIAAMLKEQEDRSGRTNHP
jgi:hypothetical protein